MSRCNTTCRHVIAPSRSRDSATASGSCNIREPHTPAHHHTATIMDPRAAILRRHKTLTRPVHRLPFCRCSTSRSLCPPTTAGPQTQTCHPLELNSPRTAAHSSPSPSHSHKLGLKRGSSNSGRRTSKRSKRSSWPSNSSSEPSSIRPNRSRCSSSSTYHHRPPAPARGRPARRPSWPRPSWTRRRRMRRHGLMTGYASPCAKRVCVAAFHSPCARWGCHGRASEPHAPSVLDGANH